MIKNIEEFVDFQKLKDCNEKLLMWSKHFGIEKKNLLRFVWSIHKNKESVQERLNKKQYSQYKKDCETMFYAGEVEELLIVQYDRMIFKNIRQFKIKESEESMYHSIGQMAIRNAVWSYRNHAIKASFTTFVAKSIFLRIRGEVFRIALKKRRHESLKINNESDFDENFKLDSFKKHIEPKFDIMGEVFKVIHECGLTDQEAMLIKCFVNRGVNSEIWYNEYKKKYKNIRTNKDFSKQSFYDHLFKVQQLIAEKLKNIGMLPEDFVVVKKMSLTI
jgi:hypothetical protein